MFRRLLPVVALVAGAVAGMELPLAAAETISTNGVFELLLTSDDDYSSASDDIVLTVEFASPTGRTASVTAFWDGANIWRARFSPNEVGRWTWRSQCSDKSNPGLHGRNGSFDCVAYKGGNTLYRRGPLRLSDNRRYFVHSDGTPFFWLADTAWNGVLKSRTSHWQSYLKTRRSQGFTAVQFVTTQWRAFQDAAAYTGKQDIRINPDFFRPLDAKVRAINDAGLVAAPVMLWAVGGSDPGHELGEQDAIKLASYINARWGAYNVLWILGGDGVYGGDRAGRWRRIGRAVFAQSPGRLATMHPTGSQWISPEFADESWYSMAGYQSAHREKTVQWLVQGPPATEWNKPPTVPVVNLEPNYEGILAYDTKRPIGAMAVRRALYRSLLVSPTAGVTYGHHGIWWWGVEPEVPLAHEKTGTAIPWSEAVKSEGAISVQHLARLFGAIQWWTLFPDPYLVIDQRPDADSYVPASRSADGTLALVYLPQGGSIKLDTRRIKDSVVARWFNPATGEYFPAGKLTLDSIEMKAPGPGDWVLVLRS